MRYVAEIAGALLLFGMLATTAWADPPEGYDFLAFDEGLHQAQQADRPIFLYFGRHGCGFCDMTNERSFSDPDLKALYEDHYTLVYVDAESGDRLTLPSGERITEMALGQRLNVYATPVFVYMEPDGTQILRIPGFQTAEDFKLYDRYISGGYYQEMSLTEYREEHES